MKSSPPHAGETCIDGSLARGAETSSAMDVLIRVTFVGIGFAPIGTLCLSTFGVLPLSLGGPWVVVPAIILGIILCRLNPKYSRRGLQGIALGLLAVSIYDMTCRLPFVLLGMWPDFIPKIGNYLLNRSGTHWSVGYLWRYLGNGGGMGFAFYMGFPLLNGRMDARRCGPLYGLAIFGCLLATVYLSHNGTAYLFSPTLVSAIAGMLGHLVYGAVLGYGTHWLTQTEVYGRGICKET